MKTPASILHNLALLLVLMLASGAAHAQRIGEDLAGRLNEAQTRSYVLYLRAKAYHGRKTAAYWDKVEDLRERRRHKRKAGHAFTSDDFVTAYPPSYAGPPLRRDVARIIASLQTTEPPQQHQLENVSDFLDHARKVYGFVPKRISEDEFKRRYAHEALALGLTKDQVVRVYALETGGRGTYDMQAGIDPETKKGRPISTALGYAQLLAANSVNELVKHGPRFIGRLKALAAHSTGARRSELLAKTTAVRRMYRAVRSVPNQWKSHVAFSRTPKGLGIHALNLDGDIGPWLQTIKLHGVRTYAEKAGRPRLSGAEIELMNLAGPRTGLDMMEPVGRTMPTTNFFAEAAYNRNTIVRGKTAAGLLAAIEERMNHNLRNAGSIQFAKAFDAAVSGRVRAAER